MSDDVDEFRATVAGACADVGSILRAALQPLESHLRRGPTA